MTRTMSVLVVLVAALALAACGGVNDKDSGHSMGAGSAPATAGHNAQDVMFTQMMILHHRQAVVMAEQAATRASSSKVKRLAAQIERAQDPQIQTMTGWLREWRAPMPSPGGMHMGNGMVAIAVVGIRNARGVRRAPSTGRVAIHRGFRAKGVN